MPLAAVLAAVVVAGVPAAQAQDSGHMVVEGLLESSGAPVSGVQSIRFALYDAVTATVDVWHEVQDEVAVVDGYFQARLGAAVPLSTALFWQHGTLWLGISVGDTAELERTPLETDPYAFHAYNAGMLDGVTLSFDGQPGTIPVLDESGKLPAGVVGDIPMGTTFDDFACIEGQFVRRGVDDWACADDLADDVAALTTALAAIGMTFDDFGCAPGQIVRRGVDGWACADDSADEVAALADALAAGLAAVGMTFDDFGCAPGQIVRRGVDGWACADDSADEVAALADALEAGLAAVGMTFDDFACAPGQIVRRGADGWACADDPADALAALAARLAALEVAPAAPAGLLAPFAGPATNRPGGWLVADGSARRSGDYPALFAAILTSWGDGSTGACTKPDGMTTVGCDFNLPDLRGRFLRGYDPEGAVDPDVDARSACAAGANGGRMVGSCQGAATGTPSNPFSAASAGTHSHSEVLRRAWLNGQPLRSTSTTLGGSDWDATGNSNNPTTDPAGAHTHAIAGGDAETRPVNAAVVYLIRAE
jgi:hypothetical protein